MEWRVDETLRREEAAVRSQGRFFLPALDYPIFRGVEPLMSGAQLRMHYHRHHRAYVTKLNQLIVGTPFEKMNLDDIIRGSAGSQDAIFNNAAQHYNHMFFWKSIGPFHGVTCPPDMQAALEKQYGSLEAVTKAMRDCAMSHFGSGWVWLVWEGRTEKFNVIATPNADTVLTVQGVTPLLTLDVWEHAYYADYENEKLKFVTNFAKAIDWDWAERTWKRATNQPYIAMRIR